MISIDITASEFKERYNNGDIVCLLAQYMAYDSFGYNYNLEYKKPNIIMSYIHRAEELIGKLKKQNLEIIYTGREQKNE